MTPIAPTRRPGPVPGIYRGGPVDVAALLGMPLTEAMAAAGVDVAHLAGLLGTSRQTVRRWQDGHLVGANFAPELLTALGRDDLATTAATDASVPSERAAKVRARLAELDMSNAGLIAATGVSRSSFYGWQSGRSQLSADNRARICAALDWPEDHLDESSPGASGNVARAGRIAKRLSRRRLVALAGITEPTLRRIEAGGDASAGQLVRVADALDLDEGARAELLTQRRQPVQAAGGTGGLWGSPVAVTALARWVDEAAAPRGWTRTDVARHLDVTRQALSLWLFGSARIADPTVLSRVGELVGRDPDEVSAAMSATPRPWARSGAQLRNARKERSLSQRELAGRVGVNKTKIAAWESGAFRPSVPQRRALIDWIADSGHPLSLETADFLSGMLNSDERRWLLDWMRRQHPRAYVAALRQVQGELEGLTVAGCRSS